ncbi:hypothetical protein [Neisseria meningitidis]|uniref:hypothetical protein n=1 Tax=Neisseria meningitidis TaxID=487 RepID=UPI001D00667C|nr:hypothetical protein [Neisseria meningitidis]
MPARVGFGGTVRRINGQKPACPSPQFLIYRVPSKDALLFLTIPFGRRAEGFFDAIIKINIFFFPVETPALGVVKSDCVTEAPVSDSVRNKWRHFYVPFCVLKHIGR